MSFTSQHKPALVKCFNADNLLRLTVLSSLLISLVLSLPYAQAQTNQSRAAAVAAAVSVLLLSDDRRTPIARPQGTAVSLTLNELSGRVQQASRNQAVFAEFELQDVDVEFCLDINSTANVGNSGFVVEINGDRVNATLGNDNCFILSEPDQRNTNFILVRVLQPGVTLTLSRFELAPAVQTQLTLRRLTRGGWDERAVRKVLKVFAYGGHALDAQIQEWADMNPQEAIQEMLNFDEHNLKLSPILPGDPYQETATQAGTLLEWADFISSSTSNIPIPTRNNQRDQFAVDGFNFDDAFGRMNTVRGLNPFRQRIGFWETNYHLAVNRSAGVNSGQVATYYDEIMDAHAAGLPYHEVMGVAAKSAAIAQQYGHRRNQWFENREECRCNDDFAREIHQLFYGIFGVDDPNHEDVTISQTSRMLTDMPLSSNSRSVEFGTNRHHTGSLNILGHTISGANASEKIDNLMPISIEHPESLRNLPVMMISVLADDNLNEARSNQLRRAWASMRVKHFLRFIQAYAISELFHGPDQLKYFTTHERALFIANKHNLNNIEAYFGGGRFDTGSLLGRSIGGVISDDSAGEFFRPTRNVFGGQTSIEASDSALAFENNYNRLTDREEDIRRASACNGCDLGRDWEKSWAQVLPQRADGNFYVSDVAQWLWNHVVGNLDNYTELERAHLYSLLGARQRDTGNRDGDNSFDFNFVMCVIADYQFTEQASDAPIIDILTGNTWNDYCREGDDGGSFLAHEVAALTTAWTGQEIADDPVAQDVLNQLGQVTLRLNSPNTIIRRHELEAVQTALGFIFTTPFVFAEGQ